MYVEYYSTYLTGDREHSRLAGDKMNQTFIAVSVMLFLAVLMFYGQIQFKEHKQTWGKPVTIFSGLIIIGVAIWLNLFKDKNDNNAIEREKLYQNAQATILANALINQYEGSGKCLVVHYPVDIRNRKDIDRLVVAFKDGFGGKITEVKTVPIKIIDTSLEWPEEKMMENTAEDFNTLLSQYPDYDMVIFMISLPNSKEELNKIDIFTMIETEKPDGSVVMVKDPDKNYPLVGIYNGHIGNLERLFAADMIGAMSLWKPDPTIDDRPLPDNVLDAFNKRYLIITPSAMEGIKETYPRLFPKSYID